MVIRVKEFWRSMLYYALKKESFLKRFPTAENGVINNSDSIAYNIVVCKDRNTRERALELISREYI